MKFKAFVATYSPQNGEITNKHNYFMNGLVKEDLSETDCADVCEVSGMRNLYALTDGSNSAARGEDAAFLCVEMMRSIIGANFDRESDEYFNSANDIVKGRAFEKSGASPAVDMAAVYVYGNVATVYNVGDVSVYHSHGKNMKKLSGNMPKTVETEEIVNTEGQLKLEKVSKQTAPYIGYLSDECQVVPYVSGRTKIKKGDCVTLLSKDVLKVLTEKEISEVLCSNKISVSEKAIELVNRACDKKADGNYTIEIIYAAGHSIIKGISTAFLVVLAALIIGLAVFFARPYLSYVGDAVTNAFVFVADFLTGGSKDEETEHQTVDPWVPIPDEVKEEDVVPEPEVTEEDEKPEEESKPEVQKPVTTTPSRPVYKPSVTKPAPTPAKPEQPNETQQPKQEEASQKPVETEPEPPAPPQVDNRDVELPIDFN